MAFSPLGGKSRLQRRLLADETVRRVGSAHNWTAAQVALAWLLQQGIVAVRRMRMGTCA